MGSAKHREIERQLKQQESELALTFCTFCGTKEGGIIKFKGRAACPKCIEELANEYSEICRGN